VSPAVGWNGPTAKRIGAPLWARATPASAAAETPITVARRDNRVMGVSFMV